MTDVKIPRPIGPRIVVEEFKGGLSLVERGKMAGLDIITSESNAPRPSMGLIVAIGNDPFFAEEGIAVGKVACFDSNHGVINYVEGKRYRTLDHTMITNVLDEVPKGAHFLNEDEHTRL